MSRGSETLPIIIGGTRHFSSHLKSIIMQSAFVPLRQKSRRQRWKLEECYLIYFDFTCAQMSYDQVWFGSNPATDIWGYSSVAEHLTADQEVPSSTLGAPSLQWAFWKVAMNIYSPIDRGLVSFIVSLCCQDVDSYVRLLFADNSATFNMAIPEELTHKLFTPGLCHSPLTGKPYQKHCDHKGDGSGHEKGEETSSGNTFCSIIRLLNS